MKQFYALIFSSLFAFSISNVQAQTPPCSFTGSVYVDHTTGPWMMNATANGMSMYNYSWTDTNSLVVSTANQTPFYTQWCVTIVDGITGCDTTICQDCIPDSTALCICFNIYMPVCGCDGLQYSNSCLADCADVSWTPAIPSGQLGGWLPCSQPSSCEVEISGDSTMCNLGSPQLLTAIPIGNGTSPYTYLWSNGVFNNTPILTIIDTGTYCVTLTDANGCIATECFNVSLQDIPIYSNPSPAVICYGDSIQLEFLNTPLTDIVWVPTGDTTDIIYDSPIANTTYIAEGIDLFGCDRRGKIFVTVDSCIVIPTSWDCFSGICKDLGTGTGIYSDSLVCAFACVAFTPTWDCFSGICKDIGTGMGIYSDSLVCVASCIVNALEEQTTSTRILKVIDFLGREANVKKNEVLFYIYDDGTVEKRIVIE